MRKALLSIVLVWLASGAFACGANSDCPVGDRFYRIMMPQHYDASKPLPALVFAHGYRGSAKGVLRNPKLRALISDLGVALIAADSDGRGWNVPHHPSFPDSDGSVEFAYFEAVVSDAVERFNIDRDRVVAAGFSSGGMMVWNLACARPDLFAGFIPIAGTFWKEPPETCASPATSVIHIHGDADKTVPLLGRKIRDTKQGEVPAAMDMYGRFGGFGDPVGHTYDGLVCKERANQTGAQLDFCLFSGGHWLDAEHIRHGWVRLQEAGRL